MTKATNVAAVAAVDAMFLPVIFLIFFTTHAILWVMSCCCRQGYDDSDDDNAYTNPYRIIPRKEHENYIRYERQEYLDSLRK
jgi:hypothetical protein